MNAEKTGRFIKDLRNEKKYTQQELAQLLNVSDKAVSKWETGRGFPDIGCLEDIAGVLEVSVSELLKGEHLDSDITKEDIADVASASISAAQQYVEKKKLSNIAIGFLCGAIIVLLVFIHLVNPVPIENAENALNLEILSNNEVVAVLGSNVAGYDITESIDAETGYRIISVNCYETALNNLTGGKNKTLVSLGRQNELDYVYYYPSENSDEMIWIREGLSEPSGDMITLPRLMYNYWIIIGIVLSAAGIAVCMIFRRKYYFNKLVGVAMIPVSLTISLAAVLAGSFDIVYSAPYYISGILLTAALIYALSMLIFNSLRKRHKK